MSERIPIALFNSKALFNPYQYKPFYNIMEWNGEEKCYLWKENTNILVTDEVGVGKTFEVGIILKELLYHKDNLSVLVICPVKLCDNWEKELADSFGLGALNYKKRRVLGQFNIIPYSFFSTGKKAINNDEEQKYLIQEMKNEEQLIKEQHIEGGERDLIQEKINSLDYDVLILDEAHYIRNRGKLWNCIQHVIKRNEENEKKLKIFMTGTPIFNSDDDYGNITELLGEPSNSDKKNQKEQEQFTSTSTLQGEANCYDELLHINIWPNNVTEKSGIEPNKIEQKILTNIYTQEHGRKTGFLKRISSSSFYSLMQYVNKKADFDQIEDDYIDDDGDQKQISFTKLRDLCNEWGEKSENDSKIMSLISLLEEIKKKDSEIVHPKDTNEKPFKAIIFSCFLDTCSYLNNQLNSDYHIYIITGKTPTKKVTTIKNAFRDDKEPSILICSDAAKEGHNLQFCHWLIHYDFPYTPATLGQRNGRIYRKGQENTPKVFYLSMQDGYDERLFGEIIVEKCNIIKELSEQGIISALNVLPSDADNYIKSCVVKYFKDYFENELNKRNFDDNMEDSKKKYEIYKLFLKRKFAERIVSEEKERIIQWKSKKAEELYNAEFSVEVNYAEELANFFKKVSADDKKINNEGGNTITIREMYQQKYNTYLEDVMKQIWGNDDVDQEERNIQNISETRNDVSTQFINKCDDYIKKTVKDTDRKFCHNMMRTDNQVTMGEYKNQFVPLKLLCMENGEDLKKGQQING